MINVMDITVSIVCKLIVDHMITVTNSHLGGIIATDTVKAVPAAAASVAHASYAVPAMAAAAVQVEFAAAPAVTSQAKAENSSMPRTDHDTELTNPLLIHSLPKPYPFLLLLPWLIL
jgi:hypothetical protein